MLDITVLAPEDAGIAAVAELRTELLSATENAKPGSVVVFDLSNVEKADSSLAQLIIALKAEAASKGFSVTIKGDKAVASLHAMLSCDFEDEGCSASRKSGRAKAEAKK